jgi:hypothetical protein
MYEAFPLCGRAGLSISCVRLTCLRETRTGTAARNQFDREIAEFMLSTMEKPLRN